MDQAKENILKKLKSALKEQLQDPYPELERRPKVFSDAPENLLALFKEEFEKTGASLYTAKSNQELINQFKELITKEGWKELHCKDARLLHLFNAKQLDGINSQKELSPKAIGITSAVQLIARTGSILLNSSQGAGRKLTIMPDVHIVFAHEKQIVFNIKEALDRQKAKLNPLPSMICLTTGASRTADIEKTLVMGAHGPRALYLFLQTT